MDALVAAPDRLDRLAEVSDTLLSGIYVVFRFRRFCGAARSSYRGG
jgi:hypothetical protein